jgi:hypothetical protein
MSLMSRLLLRRQVKQGLPDTATSAIDEGSLPWPGNTDPRTRKLGAARHRCAVLAGQTLRRTHAQEDVS